MTLTGRDNVKRRGEESLTRFFSAAKRLDEYLESSGPLASVEKLIRARSGTP